MLGDGRENMSSGFGKASTKSGAERGGSISNWFVPHFLILVFKWHKIGIAVTMDS